MKGKVIGVGKSFQKLAGEDLLALPQPTLAADFHCVTQKLGLKPRPSRTVFALLLSF
ncbi:hypothetical protein [Thermostichus sp. OS-CIW-31]